MLLTTFVHCLKTYAHYTIYIFKDQFTIPTKPLIEVYEVDTICRQCLFTLGELDGIMKEILQAELAFIKF